MNRTIIAMGLALAVGVLIFTGCSDAPRRGIGRLTQDESARQNDVARGLGMKLWKFEYTLTPGKYDIDVWLEQLDAETTTPKRLTWGKSSSFTTIDGGSLVVSLSDPATTRVEKHKTWRLGVSRHDTGPESGPLSGDAVYLLPNPFLGAPGDPIDAWMSSAKEDAVIQLRKEVTLIEWAAGTPLMHADGVHRNARILSLE